MKTRTLSGMTVTELTAANQHQLFLKLAKFVGKEGRLKSIESVSLHLNTETDDEEAVVVWA